MLDTHAAEPHRNSDEQRHIELQRYADLLAVNIGERFRDLDEHCIDHEH